MSKNVLTEPRIQFDSYQEWCDFSEAFSDKQILSDIDEIIDMVTQTEDFTAQQKRNFLASTPTHANIDKIRLYRNRLFVSFRDVEYCESEYIENDITDLNLVYYFNEKTWHFAY